MFRPTPEPEGPPRSPEEITRLIEVYPPSWRRWCDGPFTGGCACLGCVHWPAPSTVRGDPEGKPFPNPADRLSRAEVEVYVSLKKKVVAEAETYSASEAGRPGIGFYKTLGDDRVQIDNKAADEDP